MNIRSFFSTKLVEMFILISLGGYFAPSEAMVSCTLLKNTAVDKNEKLIILGEGHNLTCENVPELLKLLNRIDATEHLNIILEVPDSMDDARNSQGYEGSPVINSLLSQEWHPSFSSKIRLLRTDKRTFEERLAAGCLNDIILLRNAVVTGKLPESQIKLFIEKLIIDVPHYASTTANQFYAALDLTPAYFARLKKKFEKTYPALIGVIDELQTSCSQAHADIKKLVPRSASPIRAMVWSAFKECTTLEQLDERLGKMRAIFNALSDPIIDLAYIEQLILLREKGRKYIIFFIGEGHVPRLKALCKKLNLDEVSTLSRVEERERSAYYHRQDVSAEVLQDSIIGSVKDLLAGELFCRSCIKKEAYQSCSACKKVRYCSQECQKKDWRDHKKTCKKL